jgi:hypothetical protein
MMFGIVGVMEVDVVAEELATPLDGDQACNASASAQMT